MEPDAAEGKVAKAYRERDILDSWCIADVDPTFQDRVRKSVLEYQARVKQIERQRVFHSEPASSGLAI